jgi:hypothetical protein
MLRLTNSCKLSIATVWRDAHPSDAAADAMAFPAQLYIYGPFQTENCVNPNNTQEVDTEEEDDTQH